MKPQFLRAYARRWLPPGSNSADAERAITETVLKVAANLAHRYVFGYHDRSDIEQQGVVFALELLESGRYDIERPLENFLHVHVRNRLHNYKRDNYTRVEAPCDCCEPFNPPPEPCERWSRWHTRNLAKQNIMRPVDYIGGEPGTGGGDPVSEAVGFAELSRRLDAALPPELRADYLRLAAGQTLTRERLDAVRDAVREVLDGE